MGVKDLFTWYQKKIDTYDKEKWETTIEQRILYGLPHVQMKSTKPNTDFIDLDLVRGSPLSKVKPKQGFMTVTKLATLRCVFLPLYSKWWMQQTSMSVFVVMFCLYVSQIINIAIYSVYSMNELLDKPGENVMCMELLVPFLMTWILSLVHSQIAATSPSSDTQKSKFPKSRSFRHRLSIGRKLTTIADADSKGNLKSQGIRFNLSQEQCNNINRKKGVLKNANRLKSKTQGDDDGFESLNGNGSRTSEEEVVSSTNKDLSSVSRERCDDWVTRQSLSNRSNSESRFSTEVESEGEMESTVCSKLTKRNKCRIPVINITSTVDSTCDTDDEYAFTKSSQNTKDSCGSKVATTANEWINVTTNSEDCSYSSDVDDVSDGQIETNDGCDHEFAPTAVLNPPSMKGEVCFTAD